MARSAFQKALEAKYEDSETGCIASDETAFQSCRQAYFLKQQNQVLSEQKDNTDLQDENSELKTQMEEIRNEIVDLKNQSTGTAVVNSVYPEIEINGTGIVVMSLFISLLILATVLITKRISKK